ncbi:MAG: hypothetical protein ACRCUT_08820, partial [Spirochaetota bacterium]
LTHEDISTAASARSEAHTIKTLAQATGRIAGNRSFILFLLSTIEVNACITVISFYANYAVEIRGISSAVAAGFFAACIYAGGIAANLLFGTFDFLPLKGKFTASKLSAISGITVLIFSQTAGGFLAASVLIGISRGVCQLSFSPAVKALCGEKDATDYFSIAPLLMLPLSFGIPALSGLTIDYLPVSKGAAYTGVFAAMGILVLASWLLMLQVHSDSFRKKHTRSL